jgi:O-acetyl-ADP-ribose deacetylase (regulator of RNase III)
LLSYDCDLQAFPCISTALYGFPNDEAAPIAIDAVKKWLDNNSAKVSAPKR